MAFTERVILECDEDFCSNRLVGPAGSRLNGGDVTSYLLEDKAKQQGWEIHSGEHYCPIHACLHPALTEAP